MTSTFLVMSLFLGWPAQTNAGGDPIFDVQAILAPPLKARTLKSSEQDGIVTEEVMFHSEMDGAKSVDIFALFSYPKGGKNLPAFVWNQGGLYKATTFWTEFGAKRGYATLCIDFPIPGYRSTGGYPINSGLDLPEDPRKAPIYHGAVALLRAVSFLEARPEVDEKRIGMAGSSWGGFYTTLMVGIDARLKVGSSMFGAGNLQMGNNWWDGQGLDPHRPAAFRERWRTTLDPAWRLPKSKTPIAWFTGTNDTFYWLPAVMKTYEMAGGPKHLSILPNWNHALTPQIDDQVFAWLDVHLKGSPAFVEVTPLELVKEGKSWQAVWKIKGPRKIVAAELCLSYPGPGNWQSRYWKSYPARIKDDTCAVAIPGGMLEYHIIGTVSDAAGFRYSTPMRLVEPKSFFPEGKEDFAIDGCQEWGGFEEAQVNYFRLHGYPLPGLSDMARTGKKAALLKAGKTTLPPIYFISGVPHRFTAYLKADAETTVTVALEGLSSKMKVTELREVKVSKTWAEVALEFRPGSDLTASLRAAVTVPKGAAVLVLNQAYFPRLAGA